MPIMLEHTALSFRDSDQKKNYEVYKTGQVTIPADNNGGQLRIKNLKIVWKMPRKQAIQQHTCVLSSNLVSPVIYLVIVSNWGVTHSTKLTGVNFISQYRNYFIDVWILL